MIRSPLHAIALIASAIAAPSLVHAQTTADPTTPPVAVEEMVTDRPDQTESSSIVQPGFAQLETGVVYEVFPTVETILGARDFTTFSYPSALLRIGIARSTELRLTTNYRIERTVEPCDTCLVIPPATRPDVKRVTQGIDDVSVGLKTRLSREDRFVPETSLIVMLGLPLGSEAFKPTYVAPSFRFTMSHTLSETSSLSYNLGGAWDGEASEGVAVYTLALGFDIAEGFGGYVETFGEVPTVGDPVGLIDGGITLSPSENFQLDALAGIGIFGDAPDFFVGGGISLRIPE